VPLFKEISCQNYQEINDEIFLWISTQSSLMHSKDFWNPVPVIELLRNTPLFLSWLKNTNLEIKNVAVTMAHDIHACGAHTDTPPARYKLSWPVFNCQGSFNRWFKIIDKTITEINHLGGTSYHDYDSLLEIARREVITPALIDAGIPHDVWFSQNAKYPRIGLQCQLLREPTKL
jgi:hypothetical protein